jgi:hypothetical protein
MLRSDWSRLTCLLRDLQMLLVVLNSVAKLAQGFKCTANVAMRSTFAVLIA